MLHRDAIGGTDVLLGAWVEGALRRLNIALCQGNDFFPHEAPCEPGRWQQGAKKETLCVDGALRPAMPF